MGDGCFSSQITFSTDAFHLSDGILLTLELRRKVNVKAALFWDPPKFKFGTTRPLGAEEVAQLDPNRYWRIKVPTNYASRTRFLNYLDMVPGFEVARRLFPWKFSKSIKKENMPRFSHPLLLVFPPFWNYSNVMKIKLNQNLPLRNRVLR